MSNNENKNEQFKSLKEIETFLRDTSRPFVGQISLTKSKLKDVYDKIFALKQEKIQQSLNIVEEEEDVVDDKPIIAQSENDTVQEKAEPEKQETKVNVAPQKPVQSEPAKSQTYINPEMIKRQNPRTDTRPPYDKNKNGAPNRPGMAQKPFAPNKGKAEVVAPAPNANFKNNDIKKKKDVKSSFAKDDNKKGMSKRDLFKKGYSYDTTREDDSDTARYVKVKKAKKDTNTPQYIKIEHAVLTSENIPIKVFSEKIGKSATEIVKKLFDMGKFATINDVISFEEAELVAVDYDITLELKLDKTAEDKLKDIIDTQQVDTTKLVKRPPIVTIMGHVDHGKTSLLDYIRKSNVVMSEAGGITQHIGAYTIDLNGEKITFLDTPGHEAFTAMRRRGANVTDIAIIVVAADDGIMPQTVEAINHAKEAGVSIVVAVNKIDKTDGNLDRIKQQLTNYNLLPEDWGGDTMVCPVSAKTGQGVKELLENVLLVAEVMELKANKKCPATGSIIEASLDKGKGPVATILVQNGTLKVSDYIVAGTAIGKIRDMTDYTGKRVKEAYPSYAVQVQGFSEVPNAGDIMVVVKDEKLAKKVAQERADKERSEMQMRSNARSLDDMFKNVQSSDVKVLTLIIKGDVQGSVEAVKQSLLKLNDDMKEDNVKINIIHSAVGAINESDVMLADTANNAVIIAFNVKAEAKAQALADRSGIEIKHYSIIYDTINDIEKALKGMLEPTYREVILGHAEVRATFRISSFGTIAGSYITDGKVARNSKVRVVRDNIIIYEGVLSSLKREKDDAKEVASGYECGIGLEKFNDVKVGDVIESYVLEQIEHE
ncbi:MAG: translation initiation factor IF-2 [Clostridia bacterium]|nr:translation initiation factor IF-2 [Clostridia bacterium]